MVRARFTRAGSATGGWRCGLELGCGDAEQLADGSLGGVHGCLSLMGLYARSAIRLACPERFLIRSEGESVRPSAPALGAPPISPQSVASKPEHEHQEKPD
jgi:hypothetical protein